MSTIPNPAIIPGILPSDFRPEPEDLPLEADPHFGNEDAEDHEDQDTSSDSKEPMKRD